MKKIIPVILIILLCSCTHETNSTRKSYANKKSHTIKTEYQKSESKQNKTEPVKERIKETTSVSNVLKKEKTKIQIKPICQYPELPTGCEITSLTMLLNALGYDVDKCELSDKYLSKGAVGTVDFRKAFEGDPRDSNSYGCYAPVIVDAANKYLKDQGTSKRAYDLTGSDFSMLFKYVKKGYPVMVWCTFKLEQGHYSVTWKVNGEELTWYTPEHCMVLFGCNSQRVKVADPATGEIKIFSKELFETRYNELNKQAVIIK